MSQIYDEGVPRQEAHRIEDRMEIMEHELFQDTAVTSNGDGALRVTLTASCSCGGFEVSQALWSLDDATKRKFMAHVRAVEHEFTSWRPK